MYKCNEPGREDWETRITTELLGRAGRNLVNRRLLWLLRLLRTRLGLLIGGGFALLWLLVRSGAKPSRMSYPCQQAAAATATTGLFAPLLATFIALRSRARGVRFAPPIFAAGGAVVMLGLAAGAFWPSPGEGGTPWAPLQPRDDYEAQVYVLDGAQGPNGQHFRGLDDLIRWMGANGEPFYRSQSPTSYVAGRAGIIAANDVVVIKINYQWSQRGGTNVDLLRGLIRRILDHPDGFDGEIVVCENAQFAAVNNFDRPENNAENRALSPHDVVAEFDDDGFTVSHFDWTAIRWIEVGEYSSGDMNDGYIVYPLDPGLAGRVSYPKFTTAHGSHVSLRHGIWDPAEETYDRARLKFINVPVLKSHHSTYGVTACVKNYMGVVTSVLGTNSHSAIANGILGSLLGEIRLADLNILDCIWINANPYSGPATSYAGATRVDKLVAGIDPVAIDMWAAKYILIPAFVANGYTPPWPTPSADPDDPASAFRGYLDNSMNRILFSGQNATNAFDRIHASRWDGDAGLPGDVNADELTDGRDVHEFVAAMLGGSVDPVSILRADLDEDGDLDPRDASQLVAALLGT